jgi:N-acyl amino acid synthase of PEP-CTERM/exosortase system
MFFVILNFTGSVGVRGIKMHFSVLAINGLRYSMNRFKSACDTSTANNSLRKGAATLASDEADAISQYFSRYLTPIIANSEDLKQQAYKLRHKVYCEELQYEAINAAQLECDEFDSRAIHCVIQHVGSSTLAGTLRLIPSKHCDELLPLEKFCTQAITHPQLHPNNFLRHQVCEISRLAVPASFRKRQTDKFLGSATGTINELTFSTHELRYFPYIAISLYLSAIAICRKARCFHVFVMMEPRLARSLDFVGIHFTQLGPVIDYHGKRAAYYVDSRELRKNLSLGYKKFLEMIEGELFGC